MNKQTNKQINKQTNKQTKNKSAQKNQTNRKHLPFQNDGKYTYFHCE